MALMEGGMKFMLPIVALSLSNPLKVVLSKCCVYSGFLIQVNNTEFRKLQFFKWEF